MVAHELMDYNLPKALSKNLDSCKRYYFLKELEFTDKKGNKQTTSLASVVKEIIQRKI